MRHGGTEAAADDAEGTLNAKDYWRLFRCGPAGTDWQIIVFAPDEYPVYVWFRPEGILAGTTISSDRFYDENMPSVHTMQANTSRLSMLAARRRHGRLCRS